MKLQLLVGIVCLILTAPLKGAALSLTSAAEKGAVVSLPSSPLAAVALSGESKEEAGPPSLHVPDIAPGTFANLNTKGHALLKNTYHNYMNDVQKVTTFPRSVLLAVFDCLPLQELPQEIQAYAGTAPLQERIVLQQGDMIRNLCWRTKSSVVTSSWGDLFLWDITQPAHPIKKKHASTSPTVDIAYNPVHNALACLSEHRELLLVKTSDTDLNVRSQDHSWCKFNQKMCWSGDGTKLAIIGTENKEGKQHCLEIWHLAWGIYGMAKLNLFSRTYFDVKKDNGLTIKEISWAEDNRYIFLVEQLEGIYRFDALEEVHDSYQGMASTRSIKKNLYQKFGLVMYAPAQGQCKYIAYAEYVNESLCIVINRKHSIRSKKIILDKDMRGTLLCWKNGLLVCSVRLPVKTLDIGGVLFEEAGQGYTDRIMIIEPETGSIINAYECTTYDKNNLMSLSPDEAYVACLDYKSGGIRTVTPSITTATQVETMATTSTPAKYFSPVQKHLEVLRQQRELSARYAYQRRIQQASIIAGAAGVGVSVAQKNPRLCLASLCIGAGMYQPAFYLAKFLANYKK